MISDNKLYTWIDVQDSIITYFKSANDKDLINYNFRIYWDGVDINYANLNLESIEQLLERIFLSRYKNEDDKRFIILEGDRLLNINLNAVQAEDLNTLPFTPSISRPAFIGVKDKVDVGGRIAIDSPIIYAFHSFKGGVGRTLHAISMALNLAKKQKVLLIDADFEAPGISWLVNTPVSFADFLALVHGSNDHEESIKLVADNLRSDTKEDSNLYILPAFRSLSSVSAPNLEIKPEHLFRFSDNPFILTDLLIKLAQQLDAETILIDLRAGVSELSTGWFFDPKINKVFVTTLSSQSILGTSMMFKLLSKFEFQNQLRSTNSPIPSLIVSQVPEGLLTEMEANWNDIYASEGLLNSLRTAFVESFVNVDDYRESESYKELTEEQIIGKVLEPQTLFSEEYSSLKSLPDTWEEVVKLIKLNGLDKRLSKIEDIIPTLETPSSISLSDLRHRLEKSANNLIFAETKTQDGFLQTDAIKKLVSSFHINLPVAVVIGAKGSGKTFLYKQIFLLRDWKTFGKNISANFTNNGIILPVTLPANLQSQERTDFSTIPEAIRNVITQKDNSNIWYNYIKPNIETSITQDLTVSQWREKWFDYIAWSAGYKINIDNVGREFLTELKVINLKIVAIFDGLEDLFKQFDDNSQQQKALESLLQDVPTWLESQPERNLGVLVFVRKDIVTAAIRQNSKQFVKKYEPFELKWNVEEALRLVHWVMNKYVISENPTFPDWEKTIGEKNEVELIKPLYMLWGMRMAKDTSKEAYSHNWILGSLANLKKEIQSRDIIRFLYFAAQKTIHAVPQIANIYNDRILIPTSIRDSIDEVGKEKIEEVKIENEPLKAILELLQNKTSELKFPCKAEEILQVVQDKGIQILADNGVIVLHNGEYYMAELYRKGIGFEYSRKGRPKVLYF